MWPKRPFVFAVATFTPSRNILELLQKWKDISELMDATISWLEWFGAARTPSDFDIDINSKDGEHSDALFKCQRNK